nr:MAG TPA: protein of unknown function (DUF4512) [Caudoviricetes sp.]
MIMMNGQYELLTVCIPCVPIYIYVFLWFFLWLDFYFSRMNPVTRST